jgi:hypothetical protein
MTESASSSYLQLNSDFEESNKQSFTTISFLEHLRVQILLNFVAGVRNYYSVAILVGLFKILTLFPD